MMKRREFLKSASGLAAGIGLANPVLVERPIAPAEQASKEARLPRTEKLTAHIANFVVNTQLTEIPTETIELGKKSILDGLGLALSGSKAETAGLIQKYVKPFGFPPSGASVLDRKSTRLNS